MKITNITINNLISDAKTSLKSGAYFSALSLAFALVSECAELEYPDEWFDKNADGDIYLKEHFPSHYIVETGKYNHKKYKSHDSERFIMWLDDWVNTHNCDDGIKEEMQAYEDWYNENRQSSNGQMPIINGELIYKLRCKLFHEASIDIEFQKLNDNENKQITTDTFALILEDNNPFDVYPSGIVSTSSDEISSLAINVNGLVSMLLHLVSLYYEKHIEKKFNEIKIVDMHTH